MNRGRSSDSLANSDADIVCSSSGSSPTHFTSDDEATTDNMYMMSGRPLMSKPRSRSIAKPSQSSESEVRSFSYAQRENYRLPTPYNFQSPGRSILSSNNQHHQIMFKQDHQNPSSSYYDDQPSSHSRDTAQIQLNNVAMDQNFGRRVAMSDSNGAIDQENGENLGYDEVIDNIFNPNPSIMERNNRLPSLPSTSRGMGTIAVRLCSRLVECQTLMDCVEFVEENRMLIDSVTRVVTHEAPAFRNYDFSNYQIDYSVKDSFNPNFWQDREPIVTTADGNCQYHAVSLSLTGTEAFTPEVRLATAVAVIDNRHWFDSMLNLIDRESVLDLVRTIARLYSWGDETTLKAIAVAINRRIFLYTCNIGKKDYEMVKSLSKEELLEAFREMKYRGGTGIHTYADPLNHVAPNNYIMLFHKSEHFIAVLPSNQQPTMFEPYNPIVPVFE